VLLAGRQERQQQDVLELWCGTEPETVEFFQEVAWIPRVIDPGKD
jgi:hypothetical protein